MNKVIIAFVALVSVVTLTSSVNLKGAVFCVQDGVYYHTHGDCAVAEKSHDHDRKIYLTSRQTAEGKLYLPCRKCCK